MKNKIDEYIKDLTLLLYLYGSHTRGRVLIKVINLLTYLKTWIVYSIVVYLNNPKTYPSDNLSLSSNTPSQVKAYVIGIKFVTYVAYS